MRPNSVILHVNVCLIVLLVGCSNAPTGKEPPRYHLIVAEGFRGDIDFSLTSNPLPLGADGALRVDIDDYGNAEIDDLERLESVEFSASFTSGQSLKTGQLRPDEVGIRSASIYQGRDALLRTVYFVGTRAAFKEFLDQEYLARNRRSMSPSATRSRHRIESYSGPITIARVDVTPGMLSETPEWRGYGAPPIDAKQAIDLARNAIRSGLIPEAPFMTGCERAALVGFEELSPTHWYWRIRFGSEGIGIGGVPPHHEVVVLMNGRIVPPEFVEANHMLRPLDSDEL